MNYLGEALSLSVAFLWTITALTSEVASKRFGSLTLNVWRMILSLIMLSATLWYLSGSPLPLHANQEAFLWLAFSGFVGYVVGDYCLFSSYILIGSRFGQLFMTLAPPTAALFGWVLLGESLSFKGLLGMCITLFGISLSILGKNETSQRKVGLKLPLNGILFGVGAGMCQGMGLVLSKIGMEHYFDSVKNIGMSYSPIMISFSSTFIRTLVGFLGFFLVALAKRKCHQVKDALHDKRGMAYTLIATSTGPFIGVSLSLMAVNYTQAGIASTLMALTPVLILWPSSIFFGQRVTLREIIGAIISVLGASLFFI